MTVVASLSKRKPATEPDTAPPPLLIITGTGRCGTHYLHKLIERAGYPTKYRETPGHHFAEVVEPGYIRDDRLIRRHPYFLWTMLEADRDALDRIGHVFLCVRDLWSAAQSWSGRLSPMLQHHGCSPGDTASIRSVLAKLLGEWVAFATAERLSWSTVDFDRRTDADYMRHALAPLWAAHGRSVDPDRWRQIVHDVSTGKKVS